MLDEAREAALRPLALSPLESCISTRLYSSKALIAPGAVDAMVDGLRRAGLPPG